MAAFPLFQLPLLAMENVLCIMNTHQLILLSLVSSRAKRAVTNFYRLKPIISVYLEINFEPSMSAFTKNEQWKFVWTGDIIGIGYKEEGGQRGVSYELRNYSTNPIRQLMQAYDYVKGVLRWEIQEIDFELRPCSTQNKSFTDWLRSQQDSIPNMDIRSDKEGFEDDVKYLLNNTIITDLMNLYISHYKDDFQVDIPTIIRFIGIDDSKFINFEELLRLKNRCICLDQSILTARDINRFLKSWMACESHLELETLEIDHSGSEAMDVIMDLPHEETMDPNFIEAFNKKFHTGVEKWFNVKRSDGKVATVGYEPSFHENRFYMVTH
uniref:F-box domain-containing protein n=1 Tax=Caenorhabditis tropicalis TaxID=1561998 RepID=A0A1I7TH75_9PELO